MTTISKCHVTLWVGPLILSYHPAKFGSIDLMELEIVSFVISVPIPIPFPIPIPMPRFTNGLFNITLKLNNDT